MKTNELCISLENAEKELFSTANTIMQKYSLPCYLMEPIIDKLHRAIIDGKNQELAAARERVESDTESE